jgi:hypothetical protein
MNHTRRNGRSTGYLAPVIGFELGARVGGELSRLLESVSSRKPGRRLGTAGRSLPRDGRLAFDVAIEALSKAARGSGANGRAAIHDGEAEFRCDRAPLEATAFSPTAHTPDAPPAFTRMIRRA